MAALLRESADHSSEAELRTDLLRSYQSIFHAAQVLVGKCSHDEIDAKLANIDPKLGEMAARLRQLRMRAIYDPDFIEREYDGDLELFRSEAQDKLKEGRIAFERILRAIRERDAAEGLE